MLVGINLNLHGGTGLASPGTAITSGVAFCDVSQGSIGIGDGAVRVGSQAKPK